MSVSLRNEMYEDAKVTTGGVLVLRLGVSDPTGISRIFVQCFPFSIANSNKTKTASGELLVSSENGFASNVFDVEIQIPEDAILESGECSGLSSLMDEANKCFSTGGRTRSITYSSM